jgi:hypothetical protein
VSGMSVDSLRQLQRALQEAPEVAERELTAAATEAVLLVEREVQERISVGATGLTRASVTGDVMSTPVGPLGVVGSSQVSALFVELGTKPHMPPVAPLVPWVRNVLGVPAKDARNVAFLVARKIAVHGTPAQRPFGQAAEATQAEVVRIYEDAVGRMAGRLAGDAA